MKLFIKKSKRTALYVVKEASQKPAEIILYFCARIIHKTKSCRTFGVVVYHLPVYTASATAPLYFINLFNF